ncbi:site-specific integrase [Clostridium botulinum]|uniref:Prophage LambdaBa04, site-specific recombinase, phage integrase family n=1 Tax=Clostridium botulinum (strain Eklund 17B / Type B) TaxID=935198 RepID=B2TMD1_CLOBB|nr:prophage LambdaBa04, site-specific recombinase, phage integrase family [Clostridium botulinum B str. Eklund 17B (NRP)]MBY6976786.1 site-specific integrase [Clostridium botulinum]MBY7002279.1 site-specific integrase [Clostridium botulinum]MCR1274118.1 site-specific integrase [Clostridium botulinum]NFD68797.1 site-specific integrase [Clostridium botulinum]
MNGSVRKKGNVWYYRYYEYVNGVKKQIERKGGITKKEALQKLNEEIYRQNNGLLKPKEILLKDYLKIWLEDYVKPNNSENTYIKYKGTVNKYINPQLGLIKLCDLKVINIEQFLSKLKKTKLSLTTIQKHYLVLNGALNKAIKLQMLNDNPCKYVDTPKRSKYKASILTFEELHSIYTNLNTKIYEDYIMKLGMDLTIETGLRRGEMCGLQWSDIDFDNKILNVNTALIRVNNDYKISNLKTDSSYRKLPLSNEIIKILKSHKSKQNINKIKYGNNFVYSNKFDGDSTEYNLIFTWENGRYIIPSNFLQRLKRLCKYCKIEKNIRWHDLRHSNATILLKNKISMKVIQERLGHSLMQTTSDIYAHVTEEMNREATDVISNVLYNKK